MKTKPFSACFTSIRSFACHSAWLSPERKSLLKILAPTNPTPSGCCIRRVRQSCTAPECILSTVWQGLGSRVCGAKHECEQGVQDKRCLHPRPTAKPGSPHESESERWKSPIVGVSGFFFAAAARNKARICEQRKLGQ